MILVLQSGKILHVELRNLLDVSVVDLPTARLCLELDAFACHLERINVIAGVNMGTQELSKLFPVLSDQVVLQEGFRGLGDLWREVDAVDVDHALLNGSKAVLVGDEAQISAWRDIRVSRAVSVVSAASPVNSTALSTSSALPTSRRLTPRCLGALGGFELAEFFHQSF